MSEIKDTYVIEWMGPYDSPEEMDKYIYTDDCTFYIITGSMKHQYDIGIKYIGISKRPLIERLNDPDHKEKQKEIMDKQFWAGCFSVSAFNNLKAESCKKRRRERAELVEHLLVRYLSIQNDYYHYLNDKKTKSNPKHPIVVVSRGISKDCNKERCNKPYTLKNIPDVLMYVDGKFFAADKLKMIYDTNVI